MVEVFDVMISIKGLCTFICCVKQGSDHAQSFFDIFLGWDLITVAHHMYIILLISYVNLELKIYFLKLNTITKKCDLNYILKKINIFIIEFMDTKTKGKIRIKCRWFYKSL